MTHPIKKVCRTSDRTWNIFNAGSSNKVCTFESYENDVKAIQSKKTLNRKMARDFRYLKSRRHFTNKNSNKIVYAPYVLPYVTSD